MVTVPTVAEKRCTKCRVLKQSTEFFKFKFSSDGLQSYCKVGRLLPREATSKLALVVRLGDCRSIAPKSPLSVLQLSLLGIV